MATIKIEADSVNSQECFENLQKYSILSALASFIIEIPEFSQIRITRVLNSDTTWEFKLQAKGSEVLANIIYLTPEDASTIVEFTNIPIGWNLIMIKKFRELQSVFIDLLRVHKKNIFRIEVNYLV